MSVDYEQAVATQDLAEHAARVANAIDDGTSVGCALEVLGVVVSKIFALLPKEHRDPLLEKWIATLRMTADLP